MSQLASPTVSEHKRRRFDVFGISPNIYKVYAVGSARVYHTQFGAKHSDWTYSQLKGLLVFGKDRVTQSGEVSGSGSGHTATDAEKYWFRVIDETSGKTVWMFKVPAGFEYHLDRPFFHIFAGRSRMFGLLFDDDDEAETIAKKVIARTCPHLQLATKSRTRHKSLSTRQGRISPLMISSPNPNSFVHVAHVGVNKNGVIETSKGIDPSWTTILADLQGHGVSQNVVLEDLDFGREVLKDVEAMKRSNSAGTTTTEEGQHVSEKNRKSRRKPPPSYRSL